MKPSIGRVVIYRSVVSDGAVLAPATITRTRETCVPSSWSPEEAALNGVDTTLLDDDTVDLLVHGPFEDRRLFAVRMGDGPGQWSWPVLT